MAVSIPYKPLALRTRKPPPKDISSEAIERKHTITPPTSDRIDRASFSSTKESISGVAQTFTDSKISSFGIEEAIDDSEDLNLNTTAVMENGAVGMPLNPSVLINGYVSPCDGFRGWKTIAVGGKVASKSFGDLMGLGRRWEWESKGEDGGKKKVVKGKGLASGQSLIEKLPMELLGQILSHLTLDIPPSTPHPRNTSLISLLLTSHTLHTATLSTLYQNITVPHSLIFRKFLAHISAHPSLGTIVRRLDFSHFNPTGAGWTARERANTKNLVPETLLQCLELTPLLQEFLAQEHIDDELSPVVLAKLFFGLENLIALDFCACSSPKFRDSLVSVLSPTFSEQLVLPETETLGLKRLSFHECPVLPTSIFSSLLPRLPHLTHLDLAHTRITSSILQSLPSTVRLTHLNLSKCSSISGPAIISFLSSHPATTSLVYLNLAMDAKSHEMLSADDLTALIPKLPKTLKSLNLKGSQMRAEHIELLKPFMGILEELGLGRHLTLSDIVSLFSSSPTSKHTLRYLDISDLSSQQLDLSTLFGSSCPLLKIDNLPLEVLEVNEAAYGLMGRNGQREVKRVGWCLKEAGRRGWIVRDVFPDSESGEGKGGGGKDRGGRKWKWGANYWGMRKIPVARQEVGGMYGLYMFKR